ncbi:efflux RND transporter periplasmic adaptor subunit [Mesorhizobium sp. BR1-1-16]|uniref:efflux RND transporter periplasmic adaptor subunit n=1 Tax=Mesorhizobium sp. BR1-1-16 TaxID=2876653 RepID=UPI001CCD2A04|nr:efflux RND transporter periplasmic adaptor subunit [Mesorhizobium sp. BR1-1-16]MBZ9938676.1 efflux RND transporter periplasmic adaptor subunit [Mesorhizobium sp. BR1-1-16]
MRKAAVLAVGVAAIIAAGAMGLGYWRPPFLFGAARAADGATSQAQGADAKGAAPTGGKGGRRGGGAVSVTVATATAGDLPVRRSTIGWIASTASTTVTTQQQGIVTRLLAANGQEVKAGDVLVELDDRAAQATLDRDTAAMTRDEAAVTSTKADLTRAQDLFGRKFDSQQQLDQATAAAASAEAVVKLDEANIAADKVVLDEMRIKAPHDGRLGAFAITVGSLIQPGNAVVTLTDIDNIEALFAVSDADVDLLRQSLAKGPVAVQLSAADPGVAPASGTGSAKVSAAAPSTDVAGQIDFIDSTIVQGSGTMSVRAAVSNKDRAFWPGQAVKVDVDLGTNRGIVIVPTVAVQQGQGGANVFVVKPDKTIDVRPVTVAGIVGDKAGISAGLSAGDQVVTEGQLSLAEGMTVNVRDGKGAKAGDPAAKTKPTVVGDAS